MAVDDRKLGSVLRALRRRRRWRQLDLAHRAGLSQASISRAERGHLQVLSVRAVRRICGALEVSLELTPRWRGADLDRLLDQDHAELLGAVATFLHRHGWTVAVEVTYARFGERGSVDILAGHPLTGSVVVVEVKTQLVSIEQTARRLDEKTRLGASIASERFAWTPSSVSRILVLPDTWPERRRVKRNGAVMEQVFPVQGRAVRAWIERPSGRIDGLWFHTLTHPRTGKRKQPSPARVRKQSPRSDNPATALGRRLVKV